MSIARWTPRAVTRVAAAGVILIAMSVASGVESSASEQAADAILTYTCSFPSGPQKIAVKIAGTFPAAATVGQSIKPGNVTVTPTLPHSALADLTKLGASSVTASERLSITVAQKGSSTGAVWSVPSVPSTPIPGTGDLALPASGTIPPTPARAVGATVFIAGPLSLVLTPHKADGGATDPASIPLACTAELGSNAIVASVPVATPGSSVTPRTGAGTRKAGRAARRQDDPCIAIIPLDPVPGEAYMAGFANVKKLKGATLLGVQNGKTTGHVLLELAYEIIIDLCSPSGDTHILSWGLLDYQGKHQLPPAKATFLTFGFMPTTATLEMSEPPGTRLDIDSHGFFNGTDFVEETTVTSKLSIRAHDALVNGVPLNVGPRCQTATPMDVTLHGHSPDYTVNTGGPLTGFVTIPPFAGCGVGEDLDPLFTASISGPDNFIKLIQGVPCTRPPDSPPLNCDPVDRPPPQP